MIKLLKSELSQIKNINDLQKKIVNKSTIFIATNIFISFLVMFRSLVFMKYYSMSELGIITLLTTIIMFVCMLQMGLLNGGYRIYSLGKGKIKIKVNNTVYSYLLLLCFAILGYVIVSFLFGLEIQFIYIIIGGFTGILSLSQNWIKNILIAQGSLKELNILNILTYIVATCFLFSVPIWGLYGGVVCIAIQPLLFVVIGFIRHHNLIPCALHFKLKTILYILTFGFIPFLAGFFDQANIQIQVWSINSFLGKAELGKFYLVTLYTLVFMLIPVSLNNLFFPPAMRYYKAGQFEILKKHITKYYLVLNGYILIAVFLTICFMEYAVVIFFPAQVVGMQFVYIVMPGLACLVLLAPISLLFNAAVILKPILFSYGLSILINLAGVIILYAVNSFSLHGIAYLRAITMIFVVIFQCISYFLLKEKIWKKSKSSNFCIETVT